MRWRPGGRVLVPPGDVRALRDALEDSGVRMTYLEGRLELMSPSETREEETKIIARLLEAWADAHDVDLRGYRSTTYRRETERRGLEPDECYCVGKIKEVPDLAIEVIVSHGGIDKLEVYRGLGVPEVWLWQDWKLTVHQLEGERYRPAARSRFLPELDLELEEGSAVELVILAPGVTVTTDLRSRKAAFNNGLSQFSTDGAGEKKNDFTIDGVANVANDRVAYSPPSASVDEFKIHTTSYDAAIVSAGADRIAGKKRLVMRGSSRTVFASGNRQYISSLRRTISIEAPSRGSMRSCSSPAWLACEIRTVAVRSPLVWT